MPSEDTCYVEMARNQEFSMQVARARRESAHSLAESAVEIADSAMDLPDLTPALVHAIKNRCDQRRWLAGQWNPMYAARTAITDADGGSLVERFRRMSEEEREQELLRLALKAGLVIEHRPAEPEKSEVDDA
jgi:hypothetical protein